MRRPSSAHARTSGSGGSVANRLPKISIVTPSFNQGAFLEEAMLSILDQGYPELEYVVMDGGSTDGSVDIIKKHAGRLAHWVSEPDKGQYAAIDKGFAKTTGDVMGWLNSDDKQTPWALSVVGEIFASFPEIEWLTTAYPLVWDERGRAVRCAYGGGYNRRSFMHGASLPGRRSYGRAWIQQESTFWRRALWERAGAHLDASMRYAGDFELWARFFQHADLYAVATPLSGFRKHGQQKSGKYLAEYMAEAESALAQHGGKSYGSIASLFRRMTHYAIGGRPLMKAPGVLARALTSTRILHPAKVCIWRDNCWEIVTEYVV